MTGYVWAAVAATGIALVALACEPDVVIGGNFAQETMEPPQPIPCGPISCEPDHFCCADSCGVCAETEEACPADPCPVEPPLCGLEPCEEGATCCNDECCVANGEECGVDTCVESELCGERVCEEGEVCCRRAECDVCLLDGQECNEEACL